MLATLRASMVLPFSLLALLTGCGLVDSLAESQKHGGPIAAEIESAVGKRPEVVSTNTAGILFVMVQFSEVPTASVPEVADVAHAAIVREFKKEPSSVTIAFAYNHWDKRPDPPAVAASR